MRATTWIAVGLLAVSLLLGATGCILDEKVIQLVFKNSACLEFDEYHVSDVYVTPDTLDIADDIDDALADQDLTRDDILEARLIGGTYQVTEFDHVHDWIASGTITVRRQDIADGPVTIVSYATQSLEAAMPTPVTAVLESTGVSLFNRALDDYLGGTNPTLVFEVNSGNVEGPSGEEVSESDSLDFEWKACLKMYIIVDEEYEVPDVFGG